MRFALGAVAALAVAVACGDVPTLPLGIAYITPVLAPSPTVAAGDTLRDSLGRAAPLRVFALGRAPGDTIRNVTIRYLLTSLGTGATIDANGYLVVPDSLQTLRLVAQVRDASGGADLQLQTPEFSIEVVPRADTIIATSPVPLRAARPLPIVDTLIATVSGVGPKNVRGTVRGIIVRYSIDSIYPATVAAQGRYHLATEAFVALRPDSTIAVDTTASGGVASRAFIGVSASGQADADSVLVRAHARTHRGVELTPARFMIRIRKS